MGWCGVRRRLRHDILGQAAGTLVVAAAAAPAPAPARADDPADRLVVSLRLARVPGLANRMRGQLADLPVRLVPAPRPDARLAVTVDLDEGSPRPAGGTPGPGRPGGLRLTVVDRREGVTMVRRFPPWDGDQGAQPPPGLDEGGGIGRGGGGGGGDDDDDDVRDPRSRRQRRSALLETVAYAARSAVVAALEGRLADELGSDPTSSQKEAAPAPAPAGAEISPATAGGGPRFVLDAGWGARDDGTGGVRTGPALSTGLAWDDRLALVVRGEGSLPGERPVPGVGTLRLVRGSVTVDLRLRLVEVGGDGGPTLAVDGLLGLGVVWTGRQTRAVAPAFVSRPADRTGAFLGRGGLRLALWPGGAGGSVGLGARLDLDLVPAPPAFVYESGEGERRRGAAARWVQPGAFLVVLFRSGRGASTEPSSPSSSLSPPLSSR
jgi:hypothetical protein